MTGLVTTESEPGAARHRSVGQGEAAAEEMVAAAVVVELRGELDGPAR